MIIGGSISALAVIGFGAFYFLKLRKQSVPTTGTPQQAVPTQPTAQQPTTQVPAVDPNITKIKNYAMTYVAQGYTKEQIIQSLQQSGYSQQQIDEALKSVW